MHSNTPLIVVWRRHLARVAIVVTVVLATQAFADAQPLTATLTAPIDGATNVDPLLPIQWTTVENAEAYVLWVGTSAGANDVVNTVELQQTSYQPASLPANVTLSARIWARVGGVWRFTDSIFTAASLTAALTAPPNGATNVNPLLPIQWTTVPNAQAYVLWVGTSAGATNVVNTVELQQTSYQPSSLPASVTLCARIWARVGGVWRFTDSTFTAASLTASLTAPTNGATNVSPLQPIQWTTVLNVQAYVLWVGTTLGGSNVVNTVELQQTSYQPASLPGNQTLYARIWAKVGGGWRFTDSAFTAALTTSTLTAPADGAVNVGQSPLFQWTSVPNAQAYVLWVGTTPGSNNLIVTNELLQTSYQSPMAFSINETLYARMWAEVGSNWRYTDSSFNTQMAPATITAPANGASNVNPLLPVQWSSAPLAEAYVLWVGTTFGTNNVVNTPEEQQTSYQPASLPANQTLYARLWTRVNGGWYHTDNTFSAASLTATLAYPADGALNVDDFIAASWASVPGADAYALYVGSSPGAFDLVLGNEVQETTYSISYLPPHHVLYARLWTHAGGRWRYSDSTFTVSPAAPEFTYPLDGATAVDMGQPISWIAARNADAYELAVGTSPGANDILDSGEITATSYLASSVSASGPTYARIWAKVHGTWTIHSDIGFTLASTVAPAAIEIPFNGEIDFSTGQPFQWEDVALARGYRLSIGTTFGASDLHDSGEIRVTRRFVTGLPVGTPLFGRLQTKINGQWQATDFTFSVADNAASVSLQIKSALWATDIVRSMASGDDNRPFGWTELLTQVFPRYSAVCVDFSVALRQILVEMNVSLPTRLLDTAFNHNSAEAHTLVEMWNPDSAAWLLLDPTFDLTVRRLDGSFATAADVSVATGAFDWTAVTYEFLGTAGDFFTRTYYLDYPLLYLNVATTPPLPYGQGTSPLPYLQAVTMPAAGGIDLYLVRCTGSASADVVVNGITVNKTCDGIDSLSRVFAATSVDAPAGPASFQLYRLRRFVF